MSRLGPLCALVLPALLAAGCCGPEYGLLGADPRLARELPGRSTFALVAPVLDDAAAWAYAEPVAAAAAREETYRPEVTRDRELPVLPAARAPDTLRRALAAADATLRELGYVPVPEGATPELVLSLGLSWSAEGQLVRVGVHLGGPIDDEFVPYLVSLAAEQPPDPGCAEPVEVLVRELVGALPPREDPPPPAERR